MQKQLGNINIKSTGKNAALSGVNSELNKITESATRASAATKQIVAQPMIAGSKKYATSLAQVSTLLMQNERNSTKWTKAEHGRTADLYNVYKSQQDALQNLMSDLKSGTLTQDKFSERISKIKTTMKDCEIGMRNAGEATMSFGTRMKNSLQKFGQYFGVSRIIYAAVREMKEMARASIEVESAMNRIQIVTGASDHEMNAFFKTTVKQAKDLGKSITDVAGSIETFSRLGYNLKDASNLSKYATIMSNVADTDVGSATTGITSIIKGYSMQASDAEHVSDVLVNVGQKYAISAEELMTAFERGGAALAASGTDFEKSAALFAATNASLQNAQTTGTMWKTVSARIRGAKTELEEMGEDTSDLAEGFSKYRQELKGLTGVDIMKNEHEYKDLYEIFTELASVWDNINGDEAKARVAEILGGTRQLSGIMSTITNIKDAEGAYADAVNSVGVSTRANDKYMETTAAHIGQLKATFQEFSASFFDSSFLKGVVDTGNKVLQILDTLIDKMGVLGTMAAAGGIAKLFKLGHESGALGKLMSLVYGSPVDTSPSVASIAGKRTYTPSYAIWDSLRSALGKGTSGEMASLASESEAAGAAMQGASKGGNALLMTLKTMGPALSGIIGLFAAFAIIDRMGTAWTRQQEKAQKAVDGYKEAKQELESLEAERSSQLSQAREIAAKYDVDVSGLNEVDQVIDKINSSDKGITLVDQAELGKLSRANEELEASYKLQQQLTEAQKRSAMIQTESASRAEKSYYENLKDKNVKKYGKLLGTANAAWEWMHEITALDIGKKGVRAHPEKDEWEAQDTTNIGLAQSSFDELKKQKKELKDINKEIKSGKLEGKELKKKKKLRDDLNNSIAETSAKTAEYMDVVSQEAEILAESDTDYAQKYTKRAKELLKSFRQMDMSKQEKTLDNLQTFFSTKSGKQIEKFLSKSAKSTEALSSALSGLGLSVNDLGIDNIKQLQDYLNNITNAAENASDSTGNFRKSVNDIEAATESANQDRDWNTVQSAYKTAKEMLKEGKTGTDDFQVMAQFLSPKNLEKAAKAAADAGGYAADEYQKAFQSVMKTADRWFGDNETRSMENFVKDFQKKGLFDVRTDEMGLWDIDTKFRTTAEAADQFGISVGAVETMLHSLEAYGYDFSNITMSGKLLDEYTDSLSKLKELRDSADNQNTRDRLDSLIKGFDKEYAGFEEDLSSLSEEQVIHIKFEYDLATIQAEIDQLKSTAEYTGNKEDWAATLAAQNTYIQTAEHQFGFDKSGVKVPVIYETSKQNIANLEKQLDGVTNGKKRAKILAEISNEKQLQQDILNSISTTHPEITPETDVSEVNAALSDYDGVITVTAKVDKSKVEQMLADAPSATIKFTADYNGVEKTVSAYKDENGVIHYTTEIDHKNVEVELDQNGTIHYRADTSNAKPGRGETQAEGSVNYRANTSGLPSSFSSVARTVKYQAETSGLPTAFSAITRTVNYVASGIGKFFGIGGASGTAHSTGTAYARGDWRVRGKGTALGGELGPEMVVRNGRWFTIGDSGAEFFKFQPNDIVFNADQTDQLLNGGKITSGRRRATALAEGTAFRLGGSSSSYKSSGRRSSGRSSGSGSSSKKTDSVLDSFKDWLSSLFDWVEVRLERVATRIDDAAQRAERAASAGNLSSAVSNYNTAISLSKKQMDHARSATAKYDAQAESVLKKAVSKGLISQSTANSIFGRDADGTIDISEYSERVQEVVSAYMSWKDKSRDAADEIEAMAEDITGYYKSIADTYKEVRENEISLLRMQADNKTTASSKNSILNSIASKYDQITSATKTQLTNVTSVVSSSKNKLKNSTAAGNITNTLTKYNKKLTSTVKEKMNAAKTSAKNGKPISAGVLSSLTEYYRYGYISGSFYNACVEYNNALDAQTELKNALAIAEETAKQEKISLGMEKIENVQAEYDRKLDAIGASKSLYESKNKSKTTTGFDLVNTDYNKLIEASRSEQKLLEAELKALNSTIQANIDKGLWTTATPEYIEAKNIVAELSVKIQDCITAQTEYNNAIRQIPYDTIEHALSLLDAIASHNESISDLKDAEGVDKLESDYLTQIEDNSKKIEEYLKKRIRAYADYEAALANGGAIGGKRAEEYLELYYEANTEINKLKEANEELKDSLRDDVWWRTFDRAHEAAQRLLDVVSGIADLISDDMYFKDGALSEFGIAQVANLTKQYELARQEIENYSNDILNLNDLYTDGYYTTEEYKEKLGELQVELLNSAKDMKSYLEEIMSMYKKIDEQELKALLSLIDKRREALKSKKDYYDYDKTIRGKTKDIKELTAQIAALEGITTAEAKAQKAKLQAQLQEAQEDLEKTQTEHHFDLLNKGLDELKDTFQNEFDEKWENLAGDLAKMAELLTAANELATQNTEQVINTLNNLLSFYGIDSAGTKIDQTFASGTKRVRGNIVGLSNESGSELLVTKHGIVSHFKPGEGVVPPDLTARLFNLAQQVKPNTALGKANINGLTSGAGASITQNYGSLINIEGSADAATVADLKRMSKDLLEKSYNYTSKRMTHDYVRTGGLRRA